MKQRLDLEMTRRGMVATRSQAESWIRLGRVQVQGIVVTKTGTQVSDQDAINLDAPEQYVSRAGLKLASVADHLGLQFKDQVVLDVGSSTGGFTDYALQHGAKLVYAVDVGTQQLHPTLRQHSQIELHEKTDIRDFTPDQMPNIVVIDVSFISLRLILPHIAQISGPETKIIAMVKPQFEADRGQTVNGVVKNDRFRRQILKDFELWSRQYFITHDKADSDIHGEHGNIERFYCFTTVK